MRLSSAVGEARWYQGKGSAEPDVRVTGTLAPPGGGDRALAVLAVGDATYVAPLDAAGALADDAPELWRALAHAAARGDELEGDGCRLIGRAGPAPAPDLGGAVRPIGADQTHTTVVLGERTVLKCYRRLGEGTAREPARVRALTAAGFDGVPAMHGAAELETPAGRHALLLLQAYVPGTWDGFAQADRDLRAGVEPVVGAGHRPPRRAHARRARRHAARDRGRPRRAGASTVGGSSARPPRGPTASSCSPRARRSTPPGTPPPARRSRPRVRRTATSTSPSSCSARPARSP